MVIGSCLLAAYAVNIAYIFKYRKEMIDFIKSDYAKLAEKLDASVDMLVDLDSFKKFSIFDLIPVFNIFYEMNNLESLKYCYEENKENVCKSFPFIEKQFKIEEEAKETTFENDKDYFIGVFEKGRPINIFFTFNGREAEILEGTHSKIISLPADDAYINLFYLLYCYYYGVEDINASYNIGEVYNEVMLGTLHSLFDEKFNQEPEEIIEDKSEVEMKLTRKK